jgi:hypothetical protein
MSAEQMLAQSGLSPELLQAPPVVREEMLLPYAAGLALVAEVHLRGGWPLVDRMFRRPPTTTHQVLHPEAYLAGEEPAPVPFPAAPAGMQVVSTGRMGELGARMAIAACVDGQLAKDFARSWAGDAYTIARGTGDSIALVWSTSWAGDGAKTFANLIQMQSVCWQEAAQAPRVARSWRISADSEVRIDGTKAGLARGLPQLALRAAADSAVAFTVRLPAPLPPLGPLVEPASARKAAGKVAAGSAPD